MMHIPKYAMVTAIFMMMGILSGACVAQANSRDSLDWAGTYRGVLPCADCPGIETRVSLLKDGTFVRVVSYLERDERPRTDRGVFSWDAAGRSITLSGPDAQSQMYQVGENVLFHLDRNGRRITGGLAEKYQLIKNKTDARLEDRTWLLVELMGATVDTVESGLRVSVRFNSESGLLDGHDGCNRFSGQYELEEGGRLNVGELAGTMMACPEMRFPESLTDILLNVNEYYIDNGELLLFKDRTAVLGRFRE